MEYPIVTCTNCNLSKEISPPHHTYEYVGDLRQQPKLVNAWCRECRDFVAALIPFSSDLMDEEVSRCKDRADQLKRAHLFWRLSSSVRSILRSLDKDTALAIQRGDYFRKHSFHPRCLNCGNGDFSPFEFSWGSLPQRLDIRHTCGGELAITDRCHYQLRSFRLTPKGLFDSTGAVVAVSQGAVNIYRQLKSHTNKAPCLGKMLQALRELEPKYQHLTTAELISVFERLSVEQLTALVMYAVRSREVDFH